MKTSVGRCPRGRVPCRERVHGATRPLWRVQQSGQRVLDSGSCAAKQRRRGLRTALAARRPPPWHAEQRLPAPFKRSQCGFFSMLYPK